MSCAGFPTTITAMRPVRMRRGRTIEADLISGFDLGDWRAGRDPGRARLCDGRGADRLGRHQQLFRLGAEPYPRAPAAGHARQRSGPDLSASQAVACPRGRAAERSADRPAGRRCPPEDCVAPCGRGQPSARARVWFSPPWLWRKSANGSRVRAAPRFIHEASGVMRNSADGDGLVLAAEVGGIVHKIENNLLVMLAYIIPSEVPGDDLRACRIVELCSRTRSWSIGTASVLPTKPSSRGWCRNCACLARHEYPNSPAYLIFDAQYLSKYSVANRPVRRALNSSATRARICRSWRRNSGSVAKSSWKPSPASTVREHRNLFSIAASTNGG